MALGANLAFFAIQALLTRRLVKKNFRSFRVYVVRQDGTQSRDIPMADTIIVWLRIFGPQFALLVLMSVIAALVRPLSPDSLHGLFSSAIWLRFLVAGPVGVGWAIRSNYRRFRLQPYGFRYV